MTTELRRPSWRQRLHFLTGDRRKEASALAVAAAEIVDHDATIPNSVKQHLDAAADTVVSRAHGDSGVAESDSVEPDLATPITAIEEVLGQELQPDRSVLPAK